MLSALKELVQKRRISTILLGLLSAAKIVTDTLGWHVISDQQVNDIANGAAATLTVITVVMSHMKPSQPASAANQASLLSAPTAELESQLSSGDAGATTAQREVRGHRRITFYGPSKK